MNATKPPSTPQLIPRTPTVPMMVRLPEDVAVQVRALAEAGDRTPSQQLRRVITAAIRDQEVRK